jgi:hypothetical protein
MNIFPVDPFADGQQIPLLMQKNRVGQVLLCSTTRKLGDGPPRSAISKFSKSSCPRSVSCLNLSIEAARSHQRLIQDVRAIGGCDDHHALVAFEASGPLGLISEEIMGDLYIYSTYVTI